MLKTRTAEVLNSPSAMQAWTDSKRAEGLRVAFVPTMGALHDGHLSLIRKAQEHADVVVASIFVNPTQFAPDEDFDSYPRAQDSDLEKLASAGCLAAYCPSIPDMYPDGETTRVVVEDLSFILEGEFRPHFFIGVATIVAKLFNHVRPDVAVFGQKDYQQLLIIRRMARDLGMPVDVIGAETIREKDGLALSSRNQYLSTDERAKAAGFAKALQVAADQIKHGTAISVALAECYSAIDAAGLGPIDYVAVRDASSLDDLGDGYLDAGVDARILAAAWMGKTRLIDNLPVTRT